MKTKISLIGEDGMLETSDENLLEWKPSKIQLHVLKVIKLSGTNPTTIYDLSKLLDASYSTIHKHVSDLVSKGILVASKKEKNGRMNTFLKINTECEVTLGSTALKDRLDNWNDYKKAIEFEIKEAEKEENSLLKQIRKLKE